MGNYLCSIVEMVWMVSDLEVMRRIVPSFAKSTLGILPMKLILRDPYFPANKLKTFEHLEKTLVLPYYAIAKEAAIRQNFFAAHFPTNNTRITHDQGFDRCQVFVNAHELSDLSKY